MERDRDMRRPESGEKNATFVIVPCYNEGPVLRETVCELLALGLQVVVVDDGSKEPAAGHSEGLAVHLLRHTVNLGQGAALQTGMDYALERGAEILVHFDADGQHDPAAIPRMTAILRSGEADVVLGSRFLDAAHKAAVPRLKRWVLRGGIAVSWVFSGLWLSDTHNGLRAMTREAAGKIRLTENGFGHATEILAEIHRARLRCQEVPALVRYTEYSQAKGQGVSNSFNLVIDLLLQKILR